MKLCTLLSYLPRGRRLRLLPMAAAALTGLAVLSAGIGPASATPSHWDRYHDEYGPQVSFCGPPSSSSRAWQTVDSRFTAHGPDGLPYYYDAAKYTDTWTNLTTGEFVTVVASDKQIALTSTDNGDGTATILFSGPGSHVVYNEDGDLIAHGAGLTRFAFLFDQRVPRRTRTTTNSSNALAGQPTPAGHSTSADGDRGDRLAVNAMKRFTHLASLRRGHCSI